MRRQLFAVTFVAIPLAAGLGALGADAARAAQSRTGSTTSSSPRSIELDAVDKSVDACGDFYQFACGGWIAKNPVPPDRRSWGRFQEVQERNYTFLKRILETTSATADGDRRKAADYYGARKEEPAIETHGPMPVGRN